MSENPLPNQPLANDQTFIDEFEGRTFEAEPTALAPMPDPNRGWSIAALVVGIVIVAIAMSGLLDDSGLLEHSAWVVPAAAFLAGCFAVIARTVQKLLRTPA